MLALLAASGEANAQIRSALEPPDLDRYLRWGPLRVRPSFQIRNVGYDDNILLRATPRISDYRATLSAGAEGVVLLGNAAFLTFDQRFDYTAYLETSEQNFLNTNTRARMTVPFGGFGFFGEFEITDAQERPVDREDIRPQRRTDRFNVGAIATLGWRTEIELAVGRQDWRFSDTDGTSLDPNDPNAVPFVTENLNRDVDTARLSATYRLKGRAQLTLRYEREDVEFEFPGRIIGVGDVRRDAVETRILPGIRFGDGGALTGHVELGRSEIEAESPELPDFSGLAADAELLYRPGRRTSFRLVYLRRPGYEISSNNRLLLNETIALRSVRYLNRVFGVELGTSETTIELFPSISGDFAGTDGRVDTLLRYDVGLRLRMSENSIGRRIEYAFRVGRYRRESTDPNFDNSQSTFGIDAIVGF